MPWLKGGSSLPNSVCAPSKSAANTVGRQLHCWTRGSANELPLQPGMPLLLSDPALTCEMRLVSDYPSVWLLPALARSGLAGVFPAAEISYVADLGGFSGMFDALIARRVILPGNTLWVDYHSPRTSEALRKGIDAAIFVDARRLRRDFGLWRLAPLPA